LKGSDFPRPTSCVPPQRSVSGFTLIELVLVVAIMLIVAAIAAPRYGQAASRYQADLAAHRVGADLRMARSTARARSASCAVVFFVDANRYQLSGIPAPDGATGDYAVALSAEPYRANLLLADFNDVPRWSSTDGDCRTPGALSW
jgi:prepilin-type N-terminal cleavage/methylation domain-containing protein